MRVLNIGSLNIDKIYTVERFVRPKETIKAQAYEEACGGKGLNQSVALARAGAEVYHAGAVGRDGDSLIRILKEAGVHTEAILRAETISGHAVIQRNKEGQNNIIIEGGANELVSKEYIREVLSGFQAGDLLLLQNEVPNIDFAMEEGKKRGMLLALNPSPMNSVMQSCRLELADYLILNEVEGSELAQISQDQPEKMIEALRLRFPQAGIVLTMGEKGAYFFDSRERLFHDIYPVKPVDTTGAGDTFCGYFIAGLAQGRAKYDCLERASAAGAIAVTRKGAAPGIPGWQEVEAMLKGR